MNRVNVGGCWIGVVVGVVGIGVGGYVAGASSAGAGVGVGGEVVVDNEGASGWTSWVKS